MLFDLVPVVNVSNLLSAVTAEDVKVDQVFTVLTFLMLPTLYGWFEREHAGPGLI